MFSGSKKLPSIDSLFKQSWNIFKASWVKLLLLTLVTWGFFALAAILAAVIIAIFGVSGALFNPRAFQNPTALLPFIAGLGVVGLLFLVVIIFVGLLLQIATLKVITSSNPKNLPIFQTLRSSAKLAGPFFVNTLVTGLITFGWTIFLVLPGIIVSFLLSFWSFAMVADGFKGLNSLRHSVAIVKAHFWGIIGRLLLIVVLGLGIQLLLSMLVGRNSGLESLLSVAVSVAFGWFALSYSAVLYKQAQVGMEKSRSNLKGLAIGSIIGLILWGLITYWLIQFIPQLPVPKVPTKTPSDVGQNNTYYNSQNSPATGLQEN